MSVFEGKSPPPPVQPPSLSQPRPVTHVVPAGSSRLAQATLVSGKLFAGVDIVPYATCTSPLSVSVMEKL